MEEVEEIEQKLEHATEDEQEYFSQKMFFALKYCFDSQFPQYAN